LHGAREGGRGRVAGTSLLVLAVAEDGASHKAIDRTPVRDPPTTAGEDAPAS